MSLIWSGILEKTEILCSLVFRHTQKLCGFTSNCIYFGCGWHSLWREISSRVGVLLKNNLNFLVWKYLFLTSKGQKKIPPSRWKIKLIEFVNYERWDSRNGPTLLPLCLFWSSLANLNAIETKKNGFSKEQLSRKLRLYT